MIGQREVRPDRDTAGAEPGVDAPCPLLTQSGRRKMWVIESFAGRLPDGHQAIVIDTQDPGTRLTSRWI
jgi:hypothetical protein